MYSAEKVFEFNSVYPFCHAPTITELSTGDLLIAWYAQSPEPTKGSPIFTSRRFYGSEAWIDPIIALNTSTGIYRNPVLFTDVEGQIWLFHVTMHGDDPATCKIYYQKSVDQGHSWGENELLRDEVGWMIRNKPIYLSNHQILLPVYDARQWQSMIMLSDDDGETWETYGEISSPKGVIQPAVVQTEDQRLLMFLRSRDGHLWQSISADQGLTWSSATPTGLPNPNSAVDMIELQNGNLVCVYNDATSARTPLTIALSTDGGETWPYQNDLEDDDGEYSDPAVIQTHDGGIHVTYAYHRQSIMHVEIDEEWIRE